MFLYFLFLNKYTGNHFMVLCDFDFMNDKKEIRLEMYIKRK